MENESDSTAVESFQEFSRPHRSAGRFPRRSLQVLERRYGASESWGRFPDARARLLRVLAAAAAPALLISGDVHLAEISVAECGGERLVDVTASGMTHSWRRQTAFPRYTVAPLLTVVMALAQFVLPHRYQATAETSGKRVYLDLNFGELDFDFTERTVAARIHSAGGVELDRVFDLDGLGAGDGSGCAPNRGDLPEWRYAAQFAVWLAAVAVLLLGPPLIVAAVLARTVLARRG